MSGSVNSSGTDRSADACRRIESKLQDVDKRLHQLESAYNTTTQHAQTIESKIDKTDKHIQQLTADVNTIHTELEGLKKDFTVFMQETARSAALNKAATELVRVRQELQLKFGGYKVVRETMLGVLQATDLALVKKITIENVTEELMLSTPDYWLAPCLVAVSAWIGNDRDLAKRAIAEALKRDEEKTALTMALICRRNNRTDTCYEWLSVYFSRQSAENFTESNFTYLNAYLNGVFGPDKNHMCDDYVAKWMREIQENGSNIEKSQIELWHDYCKDFTINLDGQFPNMKSCVPEYDAINDYLGRINSVDAITTNFSRMKHTEVDQEKLKRNIDQTLVDLISKYDEKEEPLRKEERYLKAIRRFDGDTAAARASILSEDNTKTETAIDLISQMTNIITKKKNASPSKKKTSVSFLSSYIRNGFETYITEKKQAFPETITLKVDGWIGKVAPFSSKEEIVNSYMQEMDTRRAAELSKLQENHTQRRKILKVSGLALLILSLPLFFMVPFIGIILVIAGTCCLILTALPGKNIDAAIANINRSYDQQIRAGNTQILSTLDEWEKARKTVSDFEAQSLPDIVA